MQEFKFFTGRCNIYTDELKFHKFITLKHIRGIYRFIKENDRFPLI